MTADDERLVWLHCRVPRPLETVDAGLLGAITWFVRAPPYSVMRLLNGFKALFYDILIFGLVLVGGVRAGWVI